MVAGNHRDAWVYGAVDPNSGTAAMLEAVHGIGELLKSGWKPKRTLVFCSWDGEEEGLMGSTEWVEQHESGSARMRPHTSTWTLPSPDRSSARRRCPASSNFCATSPRSFPARRAGRSTKPGRRPRSPTRLRLSRRRKRLVTARRLPTAQVKGDVPVGDLGSGSDYTAFLQHLGVPSTDVSSSGPYGVYHSVFDNFAWFKKFADPDFVYEQQMARVFGLEAVRMADADVLPYDYEEYGKEIAAYLDAAQRRRATNSAIMRSTSAR